MCFTGSEIQPPVATIEGAVGGVAGIVIDGETVADDVADAGAGDAGRIDQAGQVRVDRDCPAAGGARCLFFFYRFFQNMRHDLIHRKRCVDHQCVARFFQCVKLTLEHGALHVMPGA
jgi:hypothetical protein